MKVSPKYKRFKRINFTGDTFTLSNTRSSIIRTIEGYHSHTNTAILERLEKEAQNKGNEAQKTDRILTVYDRALFVLPYADMIITGPGARPSVSTSHGLIPNYLIVFYGLILDHPYNHIHNYLIALHGQVFKKSNLYPIIEMMPFPVYYSYATKYHKLTSMLITGYQCSNIYIDVEKGALMNKYIQ